MLVDILVFSRVKTGAHLVRAHLTPTTKRDEERFEPILVYSCPYNSPRG